MQHISYFAYVLFFTHGRTYLSNMGTSVPPLGELYSDNMEDSMETKGKKFS